MIRRRARAHQQPHFALLLTWTVWALGLTTPSIWWNSSIPTSGGCQASCASTPTLRLGGTDASVVAICERLGIVTVATVNLRDFAAVRPRHIPAFITVPGLS
jgi:hypothetical protein